MSDWREQAQHSDPQDMVFTDSDDDSALSDEVLERELLESPTVRECQDPTPSSEMMTRYAAHLAAKLDAAELDAAEAKAKSRIDERQCDEMTTAAGELAVKLRAAEARVAELEDAYRWSRAEAARAALSPEEE